MKEDKYNGYGPPPLWWDIYDWPPEFPEAIEKTHPEEETPKDERLAHGWGNEPKKIIDPHQRGWGSK